METDALGCQNLYLAAGLNLTYPQPLFLPLTSCIDHVSAIGRDGHVVDGAAFGQLRDLQVLEGRGLAAREPFVAHESNRQAAQDESGASHQGVSPNPLPYRSLCGAWWYGV